MIAQPEVVLIAAAAFVPPAIVAAVLVRVLPAAERSWLATLGAFAWGAAVASLVASTMNDAAGMLAPGLVGAARARVLVPIFLAPAFEELAKATGLVAVVLALARTGMTIRTGIVLGAIVGLGFAGAENVGYATIAAVQGGYAGLARAVYVRGVVESANHAAFGALVGAALGWASARARTPGARVAAIGLALGAATALHALWNGIVSREITRVLCNAPSSDAACAPAPAVGALLLVVPAVELAFVAPIVVVLVRLARVRA